MAKKFKQSEETDQKNYNLLFPFQIKEATSEEGGEVIKIEGYANYSGNCDDDTACFIDRSGEVVIPSGVSVTSYKKNPVILMNHDRSRVIGKAISVTKKDDGIFIKAEIHAGACEAEDFYAIKHGLVSSFSIGFRSMAGEFKEINKRSVYFITKSELYETSCVSIPCNAASGFSIVKSLADGNIYAGDLEFPPQAEQADVNSNTKSIESSEDSTVKLKLRELLTADKVKELEDLGLGSTLDELKEVDTKSFIAGEISKHLETFKEEIKTLIAEAVKPAESTKTDEETSELPADETTSTEETSPEETAPEEVSAEDFKSLSDAIETLKSLASAE